MAPKVANNSAVAKKDEILELELIGGTQENTEAIEAQREQFEVEGLAIEEKIKSGELKPPKPRGLLAQAVEEEVSNIPVEEGSAILASGPRLDLSETDPYELMSQDIEAGSLSDIRSNAEGQNKFEPYALFVNEPIKKFKDLPNGGILDRGKAFANNVSNGFFQFNLDNSKGQFKELFGPDLSKAIAGQLNEESATLLQAMSRADALTQSVEASPKGVKISVPNNLYANIMSAATEHVLMNSFNGANAEVNPYDEIMFDNKSLLPKNKNVEEEKELKQVTAATNNAQLGQLIHLTYLRSLKAAIQSRDGERAQDNPEYKRFNLDSPTKLENKEAEVLGQAAKELWTNNNVGLAFRHNVDISPTQSQTVYTLTPEGENILRKGQDARAKLFPNKQVKPTRTPSGFKNTDLGNTALKLVAGKDPGQNIGSELQEAIDNLESVENKVNKRRMKVLISTLIPALMNPENNMMYANMYNIGNQKLDKFNAAMELERRQIANKSIAFIPYDQRYTPSAEMSQLKFKIAQELKALAEFRDGLFYLSYAIQGFQGRVTPQQTHLNPTTSKTARFATTAGAAVSVKRGSRQDENLMQIYSMVLLDDKLLPNARKTNLKLNERILYEKGNKLRSLLAMSDEQYEAVSEAMTKNVPLDSPDFPKFDGLNLDPVADKDLIEEIADRMDDGPAYIDTLIDFANYTDHFKGGNIKPFYTYANAYMDGKTNGPASAGMQTGDVDLAYRTGVLRKNDQTLLDDGDIRKVLREEALKRLDTDPFGEPISEEGENYATSMTFVARTLFANIDLAKLVIMTGGYGKELGGESFDSTFQELIELTREIEDRKTREMVGDTLSQRSREEDLNDLIVRQNISEFSGHLNTIYNSTGPRGYGQAKLSRDKIRQIYEDVADSLTSVLGRESKALMRAAAGEFAVMDMPFIIQLPNGMESFIGKSVTDGFVEGVTPQSNVRMDRSVGPIGIDKSDGFGGIVPRPTGVQYQVDQRGNPIYEFDEKTRGKGTFKDFKVNHYENRATASAIRLRNGQLIPGEWAYGGAPVAPIQAIDASVVTKTVTGKSYNNLKKASNGRPYIHTIYDAFKVDANGYDVILREVNTNWMNITMDWNYLQETLKSLEKSDAMFDKLIKDKNDSDILKPSERAYMDWMLTLAETKDEFLSPKEKAEADLAKKKGIEAPKNLSNLRSRLGRFNPALMYNENNPKSYPLIDIDKAMVVRMRAVGYDVNNPPAQATFKQLKTFREVIRKNMDTKSRLRKAISEIKTGKSRLKSLMRKESGLMYTDPQGFTFPLQYYTH